MSSQGKPATLVALGIAVMLGLASTACTRENSGTPQPVETSQQTSTAAAAEGVELLDPGAEPRETLRLTMTEGSRSRATMTTTMRIGLQIGDEPMEDTAVPPTVVEMTAAVDQIVPNGDIHYTVTMDNFRAGEGPSLPPTAQQSLDQLSGLAARAVMNANGEHSEFALDIPPDVDPQTRTMVEGMSPQLAKISVPFPSEPVGTGARWITHTSTELNGIHTDVATTYTLRERTGDQYRVGVSYEQSAPQQDVDLPGMPPGIDTQVTGVAIAGSGETAGSLTMLFPLTSTAKATGTVDMRVDDGQGTEDMHQNLDMSVNVESIPT